MPASVYFVVDQLARTVAIGEVEGDGDPYQAEIPRRKLAAPHEGEVYRLRGGRWIKDAAEKRRRIVELRALQARLRASDPGGDLSL